METCPFRVIVTERGTWKNAFGRFLQLPRSNLPVEDRFLVRSPRAISKFLETQPPDILTELSVDPKDMYYSLPHPLVLDAVSKAIDRFGNTRLQTECGISTEAFLEGLAFYSRPTFVAHYKRYIKKRGCALARSLLQCSVIWCWLSSTGVYIPPFRILQS